MPSRELKIELCPTSTIIPREHNSKIHTAQQIAQIIESIREFGFNDPIAVDENNVIIEGHGRWQAARKLGISRIPVIALHGLTAEEKKAYAIAHNKLTLNGDFDFELLRKEMSKLASSSFPLLLTGFEREEFENLFEGLFTDQLPEDLPKKKTIKALVYKLPFTFSEQDLKFIEYALDVVREAYDIATQY